jgi:hypothetical protein
MFGHAQRWIAVVLGPVLVLGVAACSRKAPETPAPAPAVLTVTAVDLGRSIGGDKRVTEKVDHFAPNDVIYASVLTSGTSANAVLKATWTFGDGQLVNESEQAIAPTGDAATEFHIAKPDGWPTGKYKVVVSLNGSPTQSREFEVR